jgi:hypothetical protein
LKLSALPIHGTNRRHVGGTTLCEFAFADGHPEMNLRCILEWLPVGASLTVPSPMDGDRYLDAERMRSGYRIREAGHGFTGDWRDASLEDAAAWLRPGLSAINTKRWGCTLLVPGIGV